MLYEPCLKLRWEKSINQRYYEVYLTRDFFGWRLIRVWGRKGTSLGQIKHHFCDHYRDGESEIEKIKKQRNQKGYQLVIEKMFDAE